MPSGFSASTSLAGVCAGTTVRRQPRATSMRKMFSLTPKSYATTWYGRSLAAISG
ncbi:hypothetical protein D9M68_953350 [compost metagenome]